METKLDDLARNTFYFTTDMIRFLLAENLALKSLLHTKGLITPEEFKVHQRQAERILDAKFEKHLEEWKKSNPRLVAMFADATKDGQALPGETQSQPEVQQAPHAVS